MGAKFFNYGTYNYGDVRGHQNDNITQQQLHRMSSTSNNNNYPSTMYQQKQRSSQQGPYITQVTIRDNQHIIQSPNI